MAHGAVLVALEARQRRQPSDLNAPAAERSPRGSCRPIRSEAALAVAVTASLHLAVQPA